MSLAGNWRLKLLGRPALRWGDGDAVDLPKKAFAVAARLILNRAKCESSRAELGTFLWPKSDAVRQQAGLRTLLTRIRRGLRSYSSSPFRIDDDGVALDLEVVDCDLVGVLVRLRRGGAADVVAAIEALKEDLLTGAGRRRSIRHGSRSSAHRCAGCSLGSQPLSSSVATSTASRESARPSRWEFRMANRTIRTSAARWTNCGVAAALRRD